MEETLPDQYVYEDGKCFIVEQFVEKYNLSPGLTVFEDIFAACLRTYTNIRS